MNADSGPYKTDAARAKNIIRCLTPLKIFVNSPPGINRGEFVEDFKHEGFNVIALIPKNIPKIKRLWEQPTASVIVEGCAESPQEIMEVLTGVYSCVYLYPNSEKSYAQQILSLPDSDEAQRIAGIRHDGGAWKSELQKLIKSYSEKNREIYKRFCQEFEDKVFTVLV